jgi:hypothetical protein
VCSTLVLRTRLPGNPFSIRFVRWFFPTSSGSPRSTACLSPYKEQQARLDPPCSSPLGKWSKITSSTPLTSYRWKFKTLGLAVIPIVIATPFVWFFGGYLADRISNAVARRNGGRREPEAHLLNLIMPMILGIIGCLLFGYAGSNVKTTHWSVLLGGIFCIALSFLTANTVLSVYIVESYPQWAG